LDVEKMVELEAVMDTGDLAITL